MDIVEKLQGTISNRRARRECERAASEIKRLRALWKKRWMPNERLHIGV